jgi:zinc transport system permease protein
MELFELFKYEFFVNALLMGIFISIACGVMGSLVVSNKLSFMAGSIAHSAYAGIGLGFFLKFNPTICAIVVSIGFAIVIGIISLKNKHRTDSIISVIWAVGMAIGIILIDLTSGYNDLMSYLFGSIIAVSKLDLIIAFSLDILIVVIVFMFFKEFLAITYDKEYAKISGVPVTLLYFILLILIVLSVVLLIRIVGLIMVIAMLTIPSLISEKFTKSLLQMMILSSIFGFIFIISGIIISYFLNLSAGATIILISAIFYGISYLIKRK